jgi:hypothetical protein
LKLIKKHRFWSICKASEIFIEIKNKEAITLGFHLNI